MGVCAGASPKLPAQAKSAESEQRHEAEVRDLTRPGPKARRILNFIISDIINKLTENELLLYILDNVDLFTLFKKHDNPNSPGEAPEVLWDVRRACQESPKSLLMGEEYGMKIDGFEVWVVVDKKERWRFHRSFIISRHVSGATLGSEIIGIACWI